MALGRVHTPPRHTEHTETGTASLPASISCVRASEVGCSSTASDVHSGPVLREAQQFHCGGILPMSRIFLLKINQLFAVHNLTANFFKIYLFCWPWVTLYSFAYCKPFKMHDWSYIFATVNNIPTERLSQDLSATAEPHITIAPFFWGE